MIRYIGKDSGQFPYAGVAYVEVQFPDGTRVSGSGVLVGRNDVLTAAHVIYDPTLGGAAESVSVMLGRDGGNLPAGRLDAVTLDYFALNAGTPGFLTQLESEDDLAIIGLDQAIGDDIGWFEMGDFAPGEMYRVTGYPGAYRDASGPRLMEDTGFTSMEPYYDLVSLDGFDISPGSSGGPVWYGPPGSPVVVGSVSTDGWAASVGAQESILQSWITGNDELLVPQNVPAEQTVEQVLQLLEGEGWSVPGDFEENVLSTEAFVLYPDIAEVVDPVVRLYTGMLGRQPDRDGAEYWIRELNAGGSLSGLADSFLASDEFQALADSLGGGTEGTIEALYRNVLDRSSDAAGFSYWREAIQSGRLDLGDVVLSFTDSSEYRESSLPFVQSAKVILWGTNLQSLDAERLGFDTFSFAREEDEAASIVRLYTGVLGRDPDVIGFDYWLEEVEESLTLSDVAASFLSSNEFFSLQPNVSDAGLVEYLYQQVLGREADETGRTYWLEQMAADGFGAGDLALSFVNSREYRSSTDEFVEGYLSAHYDGGLNGVPTDVESYFLG